MGSIPTPHMLSACKWAHPVQRHSLQQQRDCNMTQLQKEALSLFINRLIANKFLSEQEKTTRIMMAIEMVGGVV